ncbi:unnamed protein product, partial [Brassica rapa]
LGYVSLLSYLRLLSSTSFTFFFSVLRATWLLRWWRWRFRLRFISLIGLSTLQQREVRER